MKYRRIQPCWSCGTTERECYLGCHCLKCLSPEDYKKWKEAHPDQYGDWLDREERYLERRQRHNKAKEMEDLFPTVGLRGHALLGPKPTDPGLGGYIAKSFLAALNAGENYLTQLGIDNMRAKILYKNRALVETGIKSGNWDMVAIEKKELFWFGVVNKLLADRCVWRLANKLDGKVVLCSDITDKDLVEVDLDRLAETVLKYFSNEQNIVLLDRKILKQML